MSFALALGIGTVVAACRVSPVAPLRMAGATWVEVVRNTPLTVLFILFFFAFPLIGITYQGFTSAVIVLTAYHSTFIAEAVRSGINTVSKGQAEAARSVGLTFPQTLGVVVLPQAFRTVVAPIGNIFVALTKNSSVATVISVHELTFRTRALYNDAPFIAVFVGAAAAYLLLTIPSGVAFGFLERRVAFKR